MFYRIKYLLCYIIYYNKMPSKYENMTMEELKKMCRQKNISGYSKLNKELLIKLIKKNMKGKNNPNYCKGSFYEVISPGGEIGYTCILENFCKHNNLDRGAIGKVINNQARHHKGWTVFKLN